VTRESNPPARPPKPKSRSKAAARSSDDVAALRRELERVQSRLTASQARRRAAEQERDELRRQNDLLEEQLVQLLKEIGHLKFLTERSDLLEREAALRDQKIAELSADVERLHASLTSGRPTALAAAAAAARAAQKSLFAPRR
jgi:chromosome segregation ATPase